ncbi:methyltransferase domain-containing protein [Pasteurellaceae bacterium LIM206]|nr:methyltransferase domain-containing protein [Pasteurellaceae bacterium LIM206]
MKWHAKSSQTMELPSSWRQIQQGKAYCNAIQRHLEKWFPQILGYQILKIGGLSGEIVMDLPLRHQIILMPKTPKNSTALYGSSEERPTTSLLRATPEALPFVQQSIDACLLINSLNFVADPHQLVREVDRVITDDGYLFISLFTPFSPLIFKRSLNRANAPKLPFRTFTPWRIIDWLELLHFEILEHKNLTVGSHRCFSPLSLIVAQKRTYSPLLNTGKVRFNPPPSFNPVGAFKQMHD